MVDNSNNREDSPSKDALQQVQETENPTPEQLRKLSQDLRTLQKSPGWALLANYIDQKLRRMAGEGAVSAHRLAERHGGQGGIDGALIREFRAGEAHGMVDIQSMPERYAEWAEEQAREYQQEQEEIRDDEG